jgi:3'-5' exoribonuclease
MTKPKKPVLKLSEMQSGAIADCFAQLSEKHRKTTQGGKPFYSCRFRDPRRVASVMVWADSGLYEDCQANWLDLPRCSPANDTDTPASSTNHR